MRYIYLLIFLFITTFSWGQKTMLKEHFRLDYGDVVRVIATNDSGWAVFSLDSLILTKYTRCGIKEWSKQYTIPPKRQTRMGDIVALKNGGFVFMVRFNQQALFTKLDNSGNILWSKTFVHNDYFFYPFTIAEDKKGRIIAYGSRYKSGEGRSALLFKINPNGTVAWAKSINRKPQSGGLLETAEGDIFVRSQAIMFKTDSVGNMLWARDFHIAMVHFQQPIEVADGYVFSLISNPSDSISYFKIGKSGNLLWGGRKVTNYKGIPYRLAKKPNGNLVGIFNKFSVVDNHTSIVEFDQDMNPIRQNRLTLPNGQLFKGTDISMTKDNNILASGTSFVGRKPFFAKLKNDLTLGCDSLKIDMTVKTSPFIQVYAGQTSSIDATLNVVDRNVTVANYNLKDTTLCEHFWPKKLNIQSDSILCKGTTLTIKNQSGDVFESYLWSTGSTGSTVQTDTAGTFWLRAIYNCGSDTLYDTVNVVEKEVVVPDLGNDVTHCGDTTLIFSGPSCADCTYGWSTGETTSSIQVTQPGNYFLTVTNAGVCKAVDSVQFITVNCDSQFEIPNVFTPNGDGINDWFEIKGSRIVAIEMRIYNRWGEQLFFSNQLNHGWNGRTNVGQEVAAGTYFYEVVLDVVENEQTVTKKLAGSLTLLR